MSNGPRYRGKTFHEYMSAKFWHPASKRNIVTVWKRKQQMEAEKRKQQSRGEEARREHERNMVRAAMGDKKAKLGITWMYDMPTNIMPRDINAPENQGDRPGMTAKNFEIKFDWQKNAPRDSHFNDMGEVRNSIFNHKPFGIEVRNVKCLKCGEWGHSNFDRVCPLFGKVGDRDNPEFDIKAEEMEILSSRLTESSSQGYKLKRGATQHVGDTLFDPMMERENKKGQLELEFLKQLDPKEKEALLERLEKERKKKKKSAKKKRTKARELLKREIEKSTTGPKLEPQVAPSDDDDEIDEEAAEDDVNVPEVNMADIDLPKRKEDIEKAERLAAKKQFARQLAEFAMMNQSDSDSSDSDSSDSDSETDSDADSDYETKPSSSGSSSPTEKVKVTAIPENVKIAPPPKAGMILVKRKRCKIDIEQEKAKKQKMEMEKLKMEKLKMLEMTKLLRKKMADKQKAELAEQQKKLAQSKKIPPSTSSSSTIVTDQDLTSGLLDCLSDKPSSGWKPNRLIAYESSDED